MTDVRATGPTGAELDGASSDRCWPRWVAPTLVGVATALTLPTAFRSDLPQRADLSFHLSVIQSEAAAWRHLGRPSTFSAALGGVEHLHPLPAVVGTPLYGLLGLPATVLGSAPTLLVALGLATFGMAWGLARIVHRFGADPRIAAGLGAATVSCGYFVTTISGRMAIGEHLGFGAILAAAGATCALDTSGGRTRSLWFLTASTLWVPALGGHPLTLPWLALIGVFVTLVLAADPRIRQHLRRRWTLLGPLVPAVVFCSASWWYSAIVFRTTVTPSPRLYLDNLSFFEPFGAGSGPSLVKVLAPWRPAAGPGTPLAAFRFAWPVLALGSMAVLIACADVPPRLRRWQAGILGIAAFGLVLLPTSRSLTRVLWPIAAVQYHWRLIGYAALLVVAAAAIVSPWARLDTSRRRIGWAVAVTVGVVAGIVQASLPLPSNPEPVSPSQAASFAETARPAPGIRNDAELLRPERLPAIASASTGRVAIDEPANPESPIRLAVSPGERYSVPVAGGPPLVVARGPGAIVGLTQSTVPADPPDIDVTNQVLVVQGTGNGTVSIAPASTGPYWLGNQAWWWRVLVATVVAAAVARWDRTRGRRP